MNDLSSSLEEQIRQAKLRAENFKLTIRQAREQEAATLKTFEDGRMKWTGSGDLQSSRNSVNSSDENHSNLNRLSRDSGVNTLRDSYNSFNLMIGEEKHSNSSIDFKKEAEFVSQISALEKQLKVQRSELIVANAELRVAKAHSAALEQKISAQFVEEKKNNPSVGQLASMEAFTKTLQTRLDDNEKKMREERREFNRTETELKRQIKDAEQQMNDFLMQKDGLVAEISVHRQQGEIFVQALENSNSEIERLHRLLEISHLEVSQLKRTLEEIDREMASSRLAAENSTVMSKAQQQEGDHPVFDDSILDGDVSGEIAVDINEISCDSNKINMSDNDRYVSAITSELERSQKSHENLKQLIDSFRKSEEDQISSFPNIGISSEPPVYPAVKSFPPPPPLLGGRYQRIPLANASDNINELRRSPEMKERTVNNKPRVAPTDSSSRNITSSRTTAGTKAVVPLTQRKSEASATNTAKSSATRPSTATSKPTSTLGRQPGSSSVISSESGKRSINVTLPTSKYAANTPPRLLSRKEAIVGRSPSSNGSTPTPKGSNVTGRVVHVTANVERRGVTPITRSVVRKSTDSSSNRNSSNNIIIAKSKLRTVDDIIHDITALSASISSSLSWDHRGEKRVVKPTKKSRVSSKASRNAGSSDYDNVSLESLSSGDPNPNPNPRWSNPPGRVAGTR